MNIFTSIKNKLTAIGKAAQNINIITPKFLPDANSSLKLLNDLHHCGQLPTKNTAVLIIHTVYSKKEYERKTYRILIELQK